MFRGPPTPALGPAWGPAHWGGLQAELSWYLKLPELEIDRGRGRAQAQEDPGEVVGPVKATAAGAQLIFEMSVGRLDHAVTLWVVSGGGDMTYA